MHETVSRKALLMSQWQVFQFINFSLLMNMLSNDTQFKLLITLSTGI